MKLILLIIVIVLFFAFVAKTTITFNPFSISCARPLYAVGCLFVMIGFVCITIASEKTGYDDAVKDITKSILQRKNNKS